MTLPSKAYVIQLNESYEFEFEFCEETQAHYCTSLEEAKAMKESLEEEYEDDLDCLEFTIYEVTTKRVG